MTMYMIMRNNRHHKQVQQDDQEPLHLPFQQPLPAQFVALLLELLLHPSHHLDINRWLHNHLHDNEKTHKSHLMKQNLTKKSIPLTLTRNICKLFNFTSLSNMNHTSGMETLRWHVVSTLCWGSNTPPRCPYYPSLRTYNWLLNKPIAKLQLKLEYSVANLASHQDIA